MKILITGGGGFVGPYLKKILTGQDVVMTDLGGRGVLTCDITKQDQVDKLIKKVRPDEIYHLAAISSTRDKDSAKIMKINVTGSLNLLRSAQKFSPKAKILLVSTAYVYGETKKAAKEDSPTRAQGAYAQSKLEMEQKALKQFPNLSITIARSFNHSGADQRLGFFFPDLAARIKEIKANKEKSIEVINPDSVRDFMHVKDTVAAYKLIMRKGKKSEVYNVSSGKKYKIVDLVKKMLKAAGLANIKIIPVLKSGLMSLYGSNSKLRKLGFKPKYSVDKIISDLI
ncbi:MAG: GDP-mannose 4,6-dehydratase [Candidatus Berkelbacteria bacterium]|nr:GDP-mannose 4,6-dehydratase [Candidatus Berkelbacteria bacterium]